MNNPLFIEQVWWALLVWFAILSTICIFMYFYNRHKGKKHDENFEKRHKEINDRWCGQIPPFKNALPPPPDLRNAMPRAIVLPAPERKGRYEPNDHWIIVWNVDEKSAPLVSLDFNAPLDPPTSYTSDSGSSSSDSSPTEFGGGTMGGGGAGGEY